MNLSFRFDLNMWCLAQEGEWYVVSTNRWEAIYGLGMGTERVAGCISGCYLSARCSIGCPAARALFRAWDATLEPERRGEEA